MIQHIIFHLADSLPHKAIRSMENELRFIDDQKKSTERMNRIQHLLDSGLGSCVFRHASCAKIMEETLQFHDGERYRLLSWVVMPNHVHALIEQNPGSSLSAIVQSWKRHTARQINLLSGKTGETLWHRDYWDRYIRDEAHLTAVRKYIENNPVSARLAERPEDWPWGSARLKTPG